MTTSVKSVVWTKSRIFHALLLRELMGRFGRGNIGFLWLVGEPVMLIAGILVVWVAAYGSVKHGLNVIPFVLTGYSILSIWRYMVGRSIQFMPQCGDLLYHRDITPIDIFVARQFAELFGVLIAFFIVYIPLVLLNWVEPINDYFTLLTAWFLAGFFCFGAGLIVGGLTSISDSAERFVQPIMYVTLPISGAFYMVAWMPVEARELLVYVPLIQANEMFRAGYFGPEVPTYWNAWYFLACGIVTNAVGLFLFNLAAKGSTSD